jgi:hypothetical protein
MGSRALALAGLLAGLVGVVVALTTALSTHTGASGVAAAQVTRVQAVTHDVRVGGVVVAVTRKPNGSVCFRAPAVTACAAHVRADEIGYSTGRSGGRVVLAGVAGPTVRAVIARLTHRGTVWPVLHGGAFYAALPRGLRLSALVKVLAGGRRVSFPATA